MKKVILVAIMCLIGRIGYAQDTYTVGDTKTVNGKTFTFTGYTTDPDGVKVENWKRKQVSESTEETKTTSAEASSATAVNGFTFEQMMQFASMLQGNNKGSNTGMEDLMKMMLFLKQLEGTGTTSSTESAEIAALYAKIDALEQAVKKGNKIGGADLGVDIGDLGVDLASLTLQVIDRNKGTKTRTGWLQGLGLFSGNRGPNDWGYGDFNGRTNSTRSSWMQ